MKIRQSKKNQHIQTGNQLDIQIENQLDIQNEKKI